MKFIVITAPDFLPHEARLISQLFDCGLDTLHLRKPGASLSACARLLEALPEDCLRHIVTHDHFTLCRDYGLQGIHLNRRNPSVPPFIQTGHVATGNRSAADRLVSASCHSVSEVVARKQEADYVLMSPIFDSISKQGYTAAYTDTELEQAASCGIIDNRVIALGGVSLDNIPQLKVWHFGGAAFLGDIWSRAGGSDFGAHARQLAHELHSNGL